MAEALESAATSIGGSVTAQGTGAYDLQLRATLAAEEIAANIGSVGGSGTNSTIYVNGSDVDGANFTNNTEIVWALSGTNVTATLTNATLRSVATNTITGTGPLLGRDLLRLTGTINSVTNPVDWSMLLNVPAGIADGTDDGGAGSGTPTYVNGTEVTQGPDFDNTSASGTVTPTTFTVTAGTNVTLTIGNASATAAGAVTTGTQSFAGAKTFTGDVTVEGTLILSGSGGGGMDSLNVTNKLTNGVLTATRVVFAGADEALADDADMTFATDTLYATKIDTTDISGGAIIATNTLTLPQSDDPDVSAAGHLAWDTDGWLRAYDGSAQVAVGRKQEEIHATVIAPNDLADAVRDAALIWSNESGMSFVITGWKAWSGTDDTTLNIEETDADGANNATVDAVEIATNGTGVFYGSDTTITAATIENGHLLWLDFDDTDTPTYVKVTIYGYYNADVN